MQVSFVVPVFNQLAFTQACLASLKATVPAGLAHEIILVDDSSTDGTRDFLRELPPPSTVLFNDRNLGYAASNNRAARVARGEFLALLNNDLVLQPGWLEPMLAAFARHPRVGIVGNIQVEADSGEVDHIGITFRDGGYPVHHREPLALARSRGDYADFPAVTAACCLVRREWFLHAGGFDEGYRNGFEDNDLCLRAREDGLLVLASMASVVRHHISQSPGRAAYEFRNAQRFLARWGPRTAELEREWAVREARLHAAIQARRYFQPIHRRLGFGPSTLRRQHRAALRAEQRAAHAATRPIRVGIDLARMVPGGANGGVKPFLFSLLAEIARQRGPAITFVIFAERSLRDELARLIRPADFLVETAADSYVVTQPDATAWRTVAHFPRADPIAQRAGLDVLYAPFGDSALLAPGLPCVSFVVDLLHREVPAALPIEEINFRHQWFSRIAQSATYFQCNSRYVIDRLVEHYGVHPSRCFRVYNVVQNRLPAPAPASPPPAGAPDGPFFFYPANFWPHKNHETLFVAYRLYAQGAGSRTWPLVLTGQPDARMKLLEELRDGLGLGDRVHFLGHLDDAAFATLWARAGALVFPSLHEGFGIPLLEAMRFGIPILAANAGSLPEVGGDACLLVDPTNPREIADALRRLAIREGLREDLVARGRARLASFSLELEAGRLAHYLESAAHRQVP